MHTRLLARLTCRLQDAWIGFLIRRLYFFLLRRPLYDIRTREVHHMGPTYGFWVTMPGICLLHTIHSRDFAAVPLTYPRQNKCQAHSLHITGRSIGHELAFGCV